MGYARKTLTWSGQPDPDAPTVTFDQPASEWEPMPADAVLVIHADGTAELIEPATSAGDGERE